MKRYHAVLRAKDADVFGILVGTLGVGASLRLYSPTLFTDMCHKPHTFLLYLTYGLY
jgi:diphthamide synthase subunit DPH2